MLRENSAVRRKIIFVNFLFIIVGLTSVLTTLALYQGVKFQENNYLRLKHATMLSEVIRWRYHYQIDKYAEHGVLMEIERLLTQLQDQASDCIKLTNGFDRLVLYSFGAKQAMKICESDLLAVGQVLEAIQLRRSELLEHEKLDLTLRHLAEHMQDDATRFGTLISKSVRNLFLVTLGLTIIASLICISLCTSILSKFWQHLSHVQKLEAQAEHERNELQFIFDNIPSGVICKDESGQIVNANAAAAEQMSQTIESLVGTNIKNYPNCHLSYQGDIKDHELTQTNMLIEQRKANADNKYWTVEIRPFQNGSRTLVVSTDVTEFEKQRQALELSKHALEAEKAFADRIIHSHPSMIVGLNRDGIVRFANPQTLKLTDYDQDKLIGQCWWKLLFPDELAVQIPLKNLDDFVQQMRDKGCLLTLETAIGVHRDILFSVIDYSGASGNDEEVIIVGLDVTEAEAMHRALQKAKAEAEAASSAKTEFLANISHEFRTPLNGVIGGLDLIQQSGSLDTEQQTLLKHCMQASEHLNQLLGDLIDLATVEAGRLELECTTFKLEQLGEEIVKAHQEKINQLSLGVKIQLFTQGDTSTIVRGDVTRLKQIINNLLHNAIKFTGEASTVNLLIHAATDGCDDPDRLLYEVSVADKGVGIPESKLETVFESFSQVDTGTTRRYGGTGLGLALCTRLTRLMGAKLSVESIVGQGTRFSLSGTFEIAKATISDDVRFTTENIIAAQIDLSKEDEDISFHVLLVEDNPTNVAVARRMLEKMGHSVEVASDGQMAVDMLVASPNLYSIVLMDVQMPVMDGVEATLRLHAQFGPEALPPIVALTANVRQEEIRRYKACGMLGCISKPIRRDVLKRTVALFGRLDQAKKATKQMMLESSTSRRT